MCDRRRCVLQLTLKQLGVAVTECVSMRDIFSSAVVSSVLGRLVQVEPLPRLLMRTILKSWEVHTDMRRCAHLAPLPRRCKAIVP